MPTAYFVVRAIVTDAGKRASSSSPISTATGPR